MLQLAITADLYNDGLKLTENLADIFQTLPIIMKSTYRDRRNQQEIWEFHPLALAAFERTS